MLAEKKIWNAVNFKRVLSSWSFFSYRIELYITATLVAYKLCLYLGFGLR